MLPYHGHAPEDVCLGCNRNFSTAACSGQTDQLVARCVWWILFSRSTGLVSVWLMATKHPRQATLFDTWSLKWPALGEVIESERLSENEGDEDYDPPEQDPSEPIAGQSTESPSTSHQANFVLKSLLIQTHSRATTANWLQRKHFRGHDKKWTKFVRTWFKQFPAWLSV